MKKFRILLLLVLLSSCKSYKVIYDPKMKTNEMASEDLRSENGPFAMKIVFDKSLEGEHVKVDGFTPQNVLDWSILFEGNLNDCGEKSCRTVIVNNTVAFYLYINEKKIEFMTSDEYDIVVYRYLIISKKGGRYKLNFTNYPA